MGVEINYALGGRQVSREEFFDGFEGQVRQDMVNQLAESLQSVPCPKHGQTATVSEVVQTDEGFNFTLTGCCDEGVAAAHESLS